MSSVSQSPTVNEVISDVRNDLRAVTLDDYVPAKYLHHKLLDTAKLFMKREADDRRLQLYPSIWVTIDQFEMEESTLIGCSDISIPHCEKVMKSKFQLPAIYTTRYGYLLNISSLDYSRDYTQITPKDFANTKTRRYQNPNKRYFWIYNGYLIIPDSFVQSVTLRAIFCNKAEGLRLDSCTEPSCIRLLSQEFTVPGHLLDDVKSATIQKIMAGRLRIQPDEFPNLDSLEKKSPVSK
jgi:hypothetical protein